MSGCFFLKHGVHTKFHRNRRNSLWTDRRTDGQTFETHFIRSTRRSWSNNSLVAKRTGAESNPSHWARHALLHMAAECIALTTRPHEQVLPSSTIELFLLALTAEALLSETGWNLLEVFTQRNFVADFFRQKLNFTGKNSKTAFCATFSGT